MYLSTIPRIFKRTPNPEESSEALKKFNDFLGSPDDPKLKEWRKFQDTVDVARKISKQLSPEDRERAIVDLFNRWPPNSDVVKYQPLARLNYLAFKLLGESNTSSAVLDKISPIVEDLYLKYLRQGAFQAFPGCNPRLNTLIGILSPQFLTGDKTYTAAREGICSLLKSGEFREDLFRYEGFDRFREKLLQDKQVRSAACEYFNVRAGCGNLNYDCAHDKAKLFGVSAHLTSQQFLDYVQGGIRNLVTDTSGRWFGDIHGKSMRACQQITLHNLNEMALFLPWGNIRKGEIPENTKAFIAELRPLVRSRVLEVVKNDVSSIFNGNSAEDLAFSVRVFLGNSFYRDTRMLRALSYSTIRRLEKFHDSPALREHSSSDLWELLTCLPPDTVSALQERPLIQKAARKFVGRLLSEMNRQVDAISKRSDPKYIGEHLACHYAYPISAICRVLNTDKPNFPNILEPFQRFYYEKLSALLNKNDPCIKNDVEAFEKALRLANGPFDLNLVDPAERLFKKISILKEHLRPWSLQHLVEKIKALHDRENIPRNSDLRGMSEEKIIEGLASTYRSSNLWGDLDQRIDRRILIQMAREAGDYTIWPE